MPRHRQPELESDFARSPTLGYEAADEAGFITCLAHGFPTPLARWHFHEEYELHLITAGTGKAFVGDWIGPFEPGHVVLCGPRLPHNWVSVDVPAAGLPERDWVIQFAHQPLAHAAQHMPELQGVMPLLERSRHGVEFFGLGEAAYRHWHAIKSSRGAARLAAFFNCLSELSMCTDYRLLSSVRIQGDADNDGSSADRISAIVHRITRDYARPLVASELAQELGLSESQFSRNFRRATGNTFTDFVNRVRVNRASQLLMESDRLITQICYEVGFNNAANFNRRFLEIKGTTPSDFRRQANLRFGPRSR